MSSIAHENIDTKVLKLQQNRQSHQLITPKLQNAVMPKDIQRPGTSKQKKEDP